jgi:anti-anti-sigma factor
MPPIEMRTTVTGREALVAVVGELDIDTAPELRLELSRCLRWRPAGLTVDLGAVEFCDCAGLNALLWARRATTESGGFLQLRSVGPHLVKLLVVTDAAPLFRISGPPLEAARSWSERDPGPPVRTGVFSPAHAPVP